MAILRRCEAANPSSGQLRPGELYITRRERGRRPARRHRRRTRARVCGACRYGKTPAHRILQCCFWRTAAPRASPGAFCCSFPTTRGTQGIWALANGAAREVWGSPRARIVGTPAVAPDGRHISFTIDDDGRTRLCVIDADGSNFKVLTDSLALRGNPAWAPDGQSVVVAAVRDGQPHLTRVYLNGDAPVSLVSEYSVDPVWSPDGRVSRLFGRGRGHNLSTARCGGGRPTRMPCPA